VGQLFQRSVLSDGKAALGIVRALSPSLGKKLAEIEPFGTL
jgi:hypothetical protein